MDQLTRKLYDEGLAKGRQESEALVSKAQSDAVRIVSEAKAEAQRILDQAHRSAEELKGNTATEIAIASRQAVGSLREMIEEMVVARSIGKPVSELSIDAGFVRDMLLAVAANWQGAAASGRVELAAMLPEAKRKEFDEVFGKSAGVIMDAGVELSYSNGVKSGFRIGPKDGGYRISFTGADFEALLGEYLKPRLAQLVFEKQDHA